MNFPELPIWCAPTVSASTVLRNESVLNNLPGEVYSIEANDISPDNFRHPISVIQAAQDQKQTNTEGHVKLLQLNIGLNLSWLST